MAVTAEDVERTARDTAAAQWSVAAVVMVGSAAAAGFTFHYLGEHWALGVLTALAVDLALAAWLRIDGRLRAVGIRSTAGIVLECVTVVQTLFLNVGAAVFRGIDKGSVAAKWLLGFAHTFLPIELLLITLAGGSAQLSLMQLQRKRAAEEQAQRDAQFAAERAEYETRQRELDARREQPKPEPVVAAPIVVTPVVAPAPQPQRTPIRPVKTAPAPRQERRDWALRQLATNPGLTGADVERQFGPPRNGAAVVKEAKQKLAEQRRGSIHAVGGRN